MAEPIITIDQGRTKRGTLVFSITGINCQLANAIRRTVMEYVETVAFKGTPATEADITILANTTGVPNEEIMHRVESVPIHVAEPWKFSAGRFEFRLDVVNKNRDAGLYVTSADIEVRDTSGPAEGGAWAPAREFFKPDPFTHDYIIIAYLGPAIGKTEQRLAFNAVASVGTRISHNALYVPGLITYENIPEDAATPEGAAHLQEVFDAWVKDGKKEKDMGTAEGRAAAQAEFATLAAQRAFKRAVDADGTVTEEPAGFIFTVETAGPMPPAGIVARALDVLAARFGSYTDMHTELPENCKTSPCATGMVGIDLVVQNETHTVMAVWQRALAERFTPKPLTFAGYKQLHPSENKMLLRLGTDTDDAQEQGGMGGGGPRQRTDVPPLKAAADCAAQLQVEVTQLHQAWTRAVKGVLQEKRAARGASEAPSVEVT